MGIFDGSLTPHPNSLLFNAFPGFWPFKMYWCLRKVSNTLSLPATLTNAYHLLCRPVRSSSWLTSPLPLRTTPTLKCPVATSLSPCTDLFGQ